MTGAGSAKVLQVLLVAAGLLALTLFTLANFVLVDVRLPDGVVRVRLAWVAVVPALCAYGAGRLSAWLRRWEVVERSARPERRDGAEAAGDADRRSHQADDDAGALPAPPC
jgi:hypothetical protein